MQSAELQAESSVLPPSPGLAKVLRHIETLCRTWPGQPLDAEGGIRLLNAEGTAPPIFWTFNAANEFPALAEQLSPSQPIVGMRSLNKIVDPTTRACTSIVKDLAAQYSETLLKRFGTGACIVGANCQAAEIAYNVALNLLEAGVEVLCFVTLDAEWQLPLPIPVKMIFGRNSDRNPLRTQNQQQMQLRRDRWSAAFPHLDYAETDGGHGEYFLPANVPSLAREICSARQQLGGPALNPAPQWTLLADPLSGKCRLELAAEQYIDCIDKLSVIPLLERGGSHPTIRMPYTDLVKPAAVSDGCVHFEWKLTPFWQTAAVLCMQGCGPLSWPFQGLPRW